MWSCSSFLSSFTSSCFARSWYCGCFTLIYKSEYYRYIVRTENEEDYVLACEDLWNENDRVSLIIPKEKIKMSLKPVEGGKQ